MTKKVLIITYYWPPSGGSGVQRWLKFVKYLPSYGWQPHVFTPENPSFAVRDPSLERDVPPEAEVMKFPIWEPYDIFLRISGWFGSRKQGTPNVVAASNKSVFQTVSTWIRGNLFVPDPRVFWVKPSVKFLEDYLKDNGIDTVITTGPPHSVHLIGLNLKKKHPHLRWLADFRDPWTEWGLWDSLKVGAVTRKIHRRLEKKVLSAADEIITITPFYVRRFEILSGRQVRLLTNGFDDEDFKDITYPSTDRFVIRHVGLINDKCDPRPFMSALKEEILGDKKFAANVTMEFTGDVHPNFKAYVSASEDLRNVTVFRGNIPHAQLLKEYGTSSLLLLILTGYKDAEGFLPGKLFEYLATRIPVLGVGPTEGDASTILAETGAGTMVASDDHLAIRRMIREHYKNWLSRRKREVASSGQNRFSRRNLTGELVKLLEE